MKTRIFTLLLAMVLVFSLIGCQGGNTPTTDVAGSDGSSQGQTTASSTEGGNFNATDYPIVNDKITLNVMWSIRDADTLENLNDMYCIQQLEELTNIHIEPEVIKEADWDTKVNLMFASGKYVDVLMGTAKQVDAEEYGVTQSLLLPVDDLIDQYMPIYKERATAEPTDVLAGLRASDGNMYSIGYLMAQNINTSGHFFISKTWLDAVGMEVPKTVDELTEVLRAFKTQDPNGNGVADEIPYGAVFENSPSAISNVFSFWGIPMNSIAGNAQNNTFLIDDNKKVQFAPLMPGFREAVEWLHLLYSEGLMDVEVLSQDVNMLEGKVTDGKTGFFSAWRLLSAPYTDWATENAILMEPVSAEGYKASMPKTMELARRGAYITASNQHVPETMRWLDAQLETEMMFTLFSGKKDEGWKINDKGLIETLDSSGEKKVLDALNVNSLFFAPGEYYYSVYQMAAHRAEKTDFCKQYTESGVMQPYSNEYLNLAPRTSKEMARCTLLKTDVDNAVKEHVANFITQGVTDQSWDAFVATFDSLHVEEYISIYQNALDKLEF